MLSELRELIEDLQSQVNPGAPRSPRDTFRIYVATQLLQEATAKWDLSEWNMSTDDMFCLVAKVLNVAEAFTQLAFPGTPEEGGDDVL